MYHDLILGNLMPHVFIAAAARRINGQGNQGEVERAIQQLDAKAISVRELTIDDLAVDWHSPLESDHFRSGCGPIEALEQAKAFIETGQEIAVLISGVDYLKSDYSAAERQSRFAIFPNGYSIMQGYTDIAQRFCEMRGITVTQFKAIAAALFENYKETYGALKSQGKAYFDWPSESWLRYVTPLFRGVDCANPLIDFEGRLLLCDSSTLEVLGLSPKACVGVKAVCTESLAEDGPGGVEAIAGYQHLQRVYDRCCAEAKVDFTRFFERGQALLELYTCYPIVPVAFLLSNGFVAAPQQLGPWLKQHSVTVTGGMNLARAPWNNAALNGLIVMFKTLSESEATLGLVHGNGGLGYKQGVALLEYGEQRL